MNDNRKGDEGDNEEELIETIVKEVIEEHGKENGKNNSFWQTIKNFDFSPSYK